jgi:hypothetical protein
VVLGPIQCLQVLIQQGLNIEIWESGPHHCVLSVVLPVRRLP